MKCLLYFIIFIYFVYIILVFNKFFSCENFKNINDYKIINTEKVDIPENTEKVDMLKNTEKVDIPENTEKVDMPKNTEKVDIPENTEKVNSDYTIGYVYEPRHLNANQNYINKVKLSKYYNEPTIMRPFPSMSSDNLLIKN